MWKNAIRYDYQECKIINVIEVNNSEGQIQMTSQLMSAFLIIDVNFQNEQTKFPYKYLFKNYIPLKKITKKFLGW